jgi:lysozyme
LNIPALLAQIERHEGYRRGAYQDSLGYWTIGIGRLIDGRKGGGITKDEARALLFNDITEKMRDLDRAIPWWSKLDDVRARVIVDMAFNLGIAGLLGFKDTLRAIHERRWDDAALGMLESKWATQVGSRAIRLAYMMRTGEEP